MQASPPPQGPLAQRRILIVDDNRDSADSLCVLLRLEGADARAEYGGRGALERLADFDAEVVVLDLGMPDMDGFSVARRIRADVRHSGTLLVALSGRMIAAQSEEGGTSPFDYYCLKPVDLASLVACLAQPAPVHRDSVLAPGA